MTVVQVKDKNGITETRAGEEDGFMLKVAEKLVEKGECKTPSEAIIYLARFGANNIPRSLYLFS